MTQLDPPPDPAAFAALAKAAGIDLPPHRLEEMRLIYPHLLDMKARLRSGLFPESEPAHLFAAKGGGR